MWLDENGQFPEIDQVLPNGIVALGGDYYWKRLLKAYRKGYFPWSNPEDPILWWCPDPRFVVFPQNLKVKRSMRPFINQRRFKITYDQCFLDLISECMSSPRQGEDVGTWISEDLKVGYFDLHKNGYAHSVEAWDEEGNLVGGLYGVAIGKIFFGESMFTKKSNASKYAFIHLVKNLRRRGFWLIDCQMPTDHLISLGATSLSRAEFNRYIIQNQNEETNFENWNDVMLDEALDDPIK